MSKTAMQELIDYIEERTPKNKTTSGIWSKAKSLLELEKQQLINFYARGNIKENKLIVESAEQYYTIKFKDNDNTG